MPRGGSWGGWGWWQGVCPRCHLCTQTSAETPPSIWPLAGSHTAAGELPSGADSLPHRDRVAASGSNPAVPPTWAFRELMSQG